MPAQPPDIGGLSTAQLLRLYAQILGRLRTTGIVRSANAPAGDLAERLVLDAYHGVLAPPSEKSWDVRTPDDRKLQVKCRVVASAKPNGQSFSPFRSWDFDACVFVLLDAETYEVSQAVELDRELVESMARAVTWVAGHRVTVAQVRASTDATDVTEEVRTAFAAL